ncbi:probable aspartyl protease At4g16563 [Actinidia eriantha]|uniref:probable aspartyl protease At4g16563 n=1 Tax=Actinidia eriantha TaxID=165200 RepID=UPI00258B3EEC|nr:probable aspartyl protease At4g16563 [Actinidia eriantha]
MAPSPSLLPLISLLTLTLYLSPLSAAAAITLALSPVPKPQFTNPWQQLNHLAASSLTRAHHLKKPSLTKTPLSPHSYGGYSVSLSFGTPPQTLPLLMDTGSSLVWVPCTHRYFCSRCDFPNLSPANTSFFIPKLSSSAKILGCKNPKCMWVLGSDIQSHCTDCDPKSENCTQICPAYGIQYGSGSTSGILLSETLDYPDKTVEDFVIGCSIFSIRQPSGIAGFGRGSESLPGQMGLKKFSYCLGSHKFDDTAASSDLVLAGGSDSGERKTQNLSYTPFFTNKLTSNSAFQEYYYLHLRKITVGGRRVKVPYRFLVPGSDGHGGTILDSGTTFTFLAREAFEVVAQEFENQMAHYVRASDVENQSGLRPCFNISGEKSFLFPEFVFHFKGGAKMSLPVADSFSFVGDSSTVCMTLVTDGVVGPEIAAGPSIILGNFQQQNFYLEYDLENERLGFRKQICK